MAECLLPKQNVEGSNPFSRSNFLDMGSRTVIVQPQRRTTVPRADQMEGHPIPAHRERSDVTPHTPQRIDRAGLDDKLRTASDRLMATLDELVELETSKRSMQPGSDEFVDLAKRIEGLAQAALLHTQRQGDLAEDTRALAGTPAEVKHTIEGTPPRGMDVILGEWRAAERHLQAAETGSPEATLAEADVRRLRDEYRRAQLAAVGDAPAG